ncbi:hypothetical protein EON79_14125 [bacterium]|nr:MAG: hypothetical protein EON79_14125 [bacterium]
MGRKLGDDFGHFRFAEIIGSKAPGWEWALFLSDDREAMLAGGEECVLPLEMARGNTPYLLRRMPEIERLRGDVRAVHSPVRGGESLVVPEEYDPPEAASPLAWLLERRKSLLSSAWSHSWDSPLAERHARLAEIFALRQKDRAKAYDAISRFLDLYPLDMLGWQLVLEEATEMMIVRRLSPEEGKRLLVRARTICARDPRDQRLALAISKAMVPSGQAGAAVARSILLRMDLLRDNRLFIRPASTHDNT